MPADNARYVLVSDELFNEYNTPYWQSVRAWFDSQLAAAISQPLDSLAAPTPPL